jgi:hypothetical protein
MLPPKIDGQKDGKVLCEHERVALNSNRQGDHVEEHWAQCGKSFERIKVDMVQH